MVLAGEQFHQFVGFGHEDGGTVPGEPVAACAVRGSHRAGHDGDVTGDRFGVVGGVQRTGTVAGFHDTHGTGQGRHDPAALEEYLPD